MAGPVGDRAILAAYREGARATANAMAVVLAYRVLAREGTEPTVNAIARETGLQPRHACSARAWLDEHAPGWRWTAGVDPAPEVQAPLVLVPPPLPANTEMPPWRIALARARETINGRRSWDLYADVYAKAADDVFAHGQIGDLIALTVDYLEQSTDDDLSGPERRRVAELVRNYGKTALYAIHEALPRAEGGTKAMLTYANVVAKSTLNKIRNGGGR